MAACGMCSITNKKLVKRYYEHTTGEQFKIYVCLKCADINGKILDKEIKENV